MMQRPRALALIAVIAVHAAMVGLALRAQAMVRRVSEETAMQVSILQVVQRDSEPPRHEFKAVLQPHQVTVPAPEIVISVTAEPVATVAVERQAAPLVAAESATPRQVNAADYLRAPLPRYPLLARQRHQQGVVLLRVTIGTGGLPDRIEIAQSSGYALLDRAACEAVRNALFRPYAGAGVPRQMQVMIPVEFALTERLASR